MDAPVDAGYPGDFACAAAPGLVQRPVPAGTSAAVAAATTAEAEAMAMASAAFARALAEGCGGFVMGTLQVALPMGALREVVPLTALHCMPSKAPGLLGAIDLRGVMLPVLDLRKALGRQPNGTGYPCVVIMVHEGRLLGLLADEVTGVFAVAPGSFKRMQVPGRERPLLAGSLRRADDGSLVNLLCPQALAEQPAMPMVDDPEPARSRHGDDAAVAQAQPLAVPMMLLRAGGQVLAIDAMAVHATLAAPVIERSVLAMGACRGVVNYLGDRVPVVDLLAHTGLGRLADDAAPRELLLLRTQTGLVGLLVDGVVDVVGVAHGATVPVPGFALPQPELFAGALPLSALPEAMARLLGAQHGAAQCLELAGQALHADAVLCALASTQIDPASRGSGGASAGRALQADPAGTLIGRRAMVTFDLAGEAAVPIEQLSEILPLRCDGQPGALGALTVGGSAMLGLVVDRGRSIPVLSLPRLAAVGDLPLDGGGSVLVVQSGADWVGFAVPRLRAIEPAEWEPSLPAHGLGEADALTHTLRSRTLAQVGLGAEQRMLRVLDLASIAQALRERRLAA